MRRLRSDCRDHVQHVLRSMDRQLFQLWRDARNTPSRGRTKPSPASLHKDCKAARVSATAPRCRRSAHPAGPTAREQLTATPPRPDFATLSSSVVAAQHPLRVGEMPAAPLRAAYDRQAPPPVAKDRPAAPGVAWPPLRTNAWVAAADRSTNFDCNARSARCGHGRTWQPP